MTPRKREKGAIPPPIYLLPTSTMLYKEFHPLKENYETLIVSVTEIEKALNITPDYMQIKDKKKLANTFWVWNLVENIVWNRIYKWVEAAQHEIEITRRLMNPERMKYYSPSWTEDKQFQWLYDWLEQLITLAEPYEAIGVYDIRSLRSALEIDFSWYKVVITGEIDWGIDWVALYDCKTAKSKWNTDEKWLTGCYQARYYSYMQFLAHPDLKEIPFTYLVFTKQKKIQLQEFKVNITREEAESFVKMTLMEYLTQVKKWDIVPSEDSLDRM